VIEIIRVNIDTVIDAVKLIIAVSERPLLIAVVVITHQRSLLTKVADNVYRQSAYSWSVLIRAELDDEVASLDAVRVRLPDNITDHPRTQRYHRPVEAQRIISDVGGIIVSVSARPQENGRVNVRLALAMRQAPNYGYDQYQDEASTWWIIIPIISHSCSIDHVATTLPAVQTISAELLRLRCGGWHFQADYRSKATYQRCWCLRIYNPLSLDQATTVVFKTRPSKLKRLHKRLQAIPSVPQRWDNAMISALTPAEPDLGALVAARWPELNGLETAATISRAFDAFTQGASLSQAIEQAH
jgi:hypothetical protein